MPFRYAIFLSFLLLSAPLRATTYEPQGDIIGAIGHYTVKKNDNLHAIARNFDIGFVELLAANPGVTQAKLKAGQHLLIPAMHLLPPVRQGLVLNLPELRLFYFTPDGAVMSFPIGIGKEGWDTPTGSTTVVRKRANPVWIPPASIRAEDPNLPDIVPAGPDNPLGQYALNLGMPGIRIHGTNRPSSIGRRASHGCIRLYPEDIEVLFGAVEVGTPVTIIDRPYRLGWQGHTLWLEVTPTQSQDDDIAAYRRPLPQALPGLDNAVRAIAGERDEIDWPAVYAAAAAHSGIPAVIGRRAGWW